MQVRRGGRTLTLGGLASGTRVPLYEFSQIETHEGAHAQGLDPTAIVTPPEQWAYAVTIPLNRSDLERHDRFCVKISVLVHAGCVGIGILQRDENSFVQEVPVGGSSSWREITLGIPNIETAGPLVIRNHSAYGPSRVQLRIVEIERVANEVGSEVHQQNEPDQLNRPAKRPLGPLLVELSADALIELAESLAIAPRLHPVPSWRFDTFKRSADPAVHVRHGLWCAAKAQRCDRAVVVPWHEGTRLELHFDNDLSLILFAGGCYEPNEFALLGRIVEPGMIFLDGGANEGVYTVFASARVGPTGRVIAVEPSPREIERLKRNIALNDMHNIDLVEAALCERPGSVDLTIAQPMHAGENTLGGFIYDERRAVDTKTVAAVTLDKLVAELSLRRLDIVKLDLEGAELRALMGARHSLAELKPLLLFEVSEAALGHQGGSCTALFDFLKGDHYVTLTFDEDSGVPVPRESVNSPLSHNMVAVHEQRDFGLLAKQRRNKREGPGRQVAVRGQASVNRQRSRI
jgi:FkbM family methyltransferase